MSPGSSDKRAPVHTDAAHATRLERANMGTPFPWRPMVAVGFCTVTVTYTLCSLFAYVGYMVQYLGVTDDKDEAGYYAGYLSSAFMVGRFWGSYFWGRFADRYGRLPVMYIGMCTTSVLSVAFGLSTSFSWAIAFRFLAGALSGVIANARSIVPEVCGSEHEVAGLSLVTGCWSIGLVLGSGLGGLLAEPAHLYPSAFSETGLFGRFPYLLPNLVVACLALISLPVVFFFLEETLDVRKGGNRSGFEPIMTPKAEFDSQEEATGAVGTCPEIGYDPQLASGEEAKFAVVGFDETYPLWAISSVGNGGLDWTVLEVGQALSACGGGIFVAQLLIYPRIVVQIGPRRTQRWLCCVAIPVYLAYPLLSQIRDSGGVLMTVSVIMLVVTNFAVYTAFITSTLAVNNAVDASQRGTLNGLAEMIASLAKGVGPICFSSTFAWSINRRRPFPLDHHLVFFLFAIFMVVLMVMSWNLDISASKPRPDDSTVPAVGISIPVAGAVEKEGSG